MRGVLVLVFGANLNQKFRNADRRDGKKRRRRAAARALLLASAEAGVRRTQQTCGVASRWFREQGLACRGASLLKKKAAPCF